VNGSITVSGQAREISAESVNGAVQVSGASTHTKAESVNGSVVVRGCYGGWMYVEYKGVKGWGAPSTLCANPLTTCA